MALKASRWINLFERFIKDIRISSKETISIDGRGAKLDLWDSQRRFMKEVGEGLDEALQDASPREGPAERLDDRLAKGDRGPGAVVELEEVAAPHGGEASAPAAA